jgi:hypothetical protein
VQLLRQPPDGAGPAAERLLQPGGGLAQRRPGAAQEPRDDADAVADRAAVGGEVDVGLDGRGVDAELAAAGHLQRPGQLDHPVVERLDRLRADGVGPADQRGVVGNLLEVDAAELAEREAVVDEVLGLGVAPAVEPHDHEHAEDHLHRRRGAASRTGPGMTAGHVLANGLKDLVIVERAVELLELGPEAEVELGHQREQIGPGVAVPEHGFSLPSVRMVRPSCMLSACKKP